MGRRRIIPKDRAGIVRLNVEVSEEQYERLCEKLTLSLSNVSHFIRECIADYINDKPKQK